MLNLTQTTWEKEWENFKIIDKKTWFFTILEKDKFIKNFFIMEVLKNESKKEILDIEREVIFKNKDWEKPTKKQLENRQKFIVWYREKLMWKQDFETVEKSSKEVLNVIKENAPDWYEDLLTNWDNYYEKRKEFIDDLARIKEEIMAKNNQDTDEDSMTDSVL